MPLKAQQLEKFLSVIFAQMQFVSTGVAQKRKEKEQQKKEKE